jgi:protocatechuate 3,4-dioxygenase beta subunit
MRSLAAAVLVLVLVLLGVFLFRSGGSVPALQPAPEKPAETPRVEQPVSTTSVEAADAGRESSRQSAREAPAVATPAAPCIVFGRVVGESDQPLAGATVRLSAYKEWASGVAIAKLPGKVDMRGWEMLTDTKGGFRFEAPLPTASVTILEILPDPFHDSDREFLGGTNQNARAPLHAGDNDLGVFRLATTGAIRGMVTDGSGSPLQDARLTVGETRSSTIGREAQTDAAGNYTIGHVKQGSYGVNAECAGYLSEFRKPIEVQSGRMTSGIDFALLAAPVLSGVVVDENGRGLEGARLWGWPSSSGSGAGTKSAADGSFTIHLPQNEPYTLEVKLDSYDTFGLDDRATHYAPNTRDLRIVLKRSEVATTRFVVIDETSGAKIENFGLVIQRDQGSGTKRNGYTSFNRRPPPSAHPGGELELSARPKLDLYVLFAPGYLRKSADVEHDKQGVPVQTLKLARGGWVSGRARIGKLPAAGASVALELGALMPTGPKLDSAPVFQPTRDETQKSSTDAEGRFGFEGLDLGTYRLVVSATTGESIEVAPFVVDTKDRQDLGDLELLRGATIDGKVLVPPGRSAKGLVVFLDDLRGTNKQLCDGEGRFRFEGVTSGQHSLLLDEAPGVLAAGAKAQVTLAAGETREVVIDARDRGTCKVVLTIEVPGHPIEGIEVTLRPVATQGNGFRLGRTDAQGRVAGWAPAAGDAQVMINFPDWTALVHPSAVVPLVLDRDVDITVRFDVGRVRLEIPASLQLPSKGAVKLEFLREGETPGKGTTLWATLGQDSAGNIGLTVEGDGRHLLAEVVLAGDFDAVLMVQANEPWEEQDGGRRIIHDQREIYRATVHVLVRAGETTDARLP